MDTLETDLHDELDTLLGAGDGRGLAAFIRRLPPAETSLTITYLHEEDQDRFWKLLISADGELAADLVEHFPDDYAEDLLGDMDLDVAARFLDRIDSDDQYEILSRLDEELAEQIMSRMAAVEARDVERRLQYDRFSAGGMMMTEILVYPANHPRQQIVNDLRKNYERHRSYEHRYLFEVNPDGTLAGTIPMRKFAYAPMEADRKTLYSRRIESVQATTLLDDLRATFDRVDHSVLPVVDERGVLVGAITRAAIQEAVAKRQEEQLMQFGGLISGEELRIMPFGGRCLKRLSFLLPSIALSYLAVSVIALYEPVIHELTILAVFLPMVANLSGAAGNQAVAVSIRELTLGLIDKDHLGRVLAKEVLLGFLNGLAVGTALGGITWLMRPEGDWGLPAVIMASYTGSSVVAVCVGGSLPLLLKRLGVDPAMLSSPMLTTLTDMASFFFVLSLASAFLL